MPQKIHPWNTKDRPTVGRFDTLAELASRPIQAEPVHKVFCSPYWQDRTCREVDTPDGRKVRISHEAYPPGGRGVTAMHRCEICKKWAPHNVVDSACTDCQIEDDEDGFAERLEMLDQGDTIGLSNTLRHLWWRRPFMPERQEDKANARDRSTPKDDAADIQQGEKASPVMEIATFHEKGPTGGRYWQADLLEVPKKPSPRLNNELLAGLIRRHLEWVARDTPRRAVGCSVILLPEDEDELLKEIAYAEATNRSMPRAERQDTVSPRVRYRRKVKK